MALPETLPFIVGQPVRKRMTLQKGTVDKKVRDAIEAADGGDGVQAADITDASTVGKALLTAASVAAQRTALSSVEWVAAPASASAAGTANQMAADTGFIYRCTATNTWKRVAIATW